MTVYATYDPTGTITGFYPDVIAYGKIPEPNIEIDEATHRDAILNPGKHSVQGGKLIAAAVWPPAPSADDQKRAADFPILGQIHALEKLQTPDLMRGALLGSPAVDPATGRTPMQQLQYIDQQIAELRKKLQ